jgi:hypothetical protein
MTTPPAQKAEEGFLSRRQERGRKYAAHGGIGMTNRGGRYRQEDPHVNDDVWGTRKTKKKQIRRHSPA